MLHSKKIKTKYFKEIINGTKTFEIRLNDCNYLKGDYIALNEIDDNGEYTGIFTVAKIVNVTSFPDGLKDNFVVLGLEPKNVQFNYVPSCFQQMVTDRYKTKGGKNDKCR